MTEIERRFFTANSLKWIAIFAMVIDHIAWKVTLPTPLFFLLHAIGRFTMPIMCFLLAEGFHHTSNRKRYALRLLIFAVISQIPFNYFATGNPFRLWIGPESLNVLFCLLFGFCALWSIKSELSKPAKVAIVSLCILLSVICDWMVFGVLWIIAFGLNRESFKRKVVWFSIVAVCALALLLFLSNGSLEQLMQAGVFLPLPLLALYNGKKAGESTPAWLTNKWLFYIIYPAHLALLGFLCYGLGIIG